MKTISRELEGTEYHHRKILNYRHQIQILNKLWDSVPRLYQEEQISHVVIWEISEEAAF
jgi:hypothetical protein